MAHFTHDYEQGIKDERERITAIVERWAKQRDLGIDALVAEIHNFPTRKDSDEFEIPDWTEEVKEFRTSLLIYKELLEKEGFRSAVKRAFGKIE